MGITVLDSVILHLKNRRERTVVGGGDGKESKLGMERERGEIPQVAPME